MITYGIVAVMALLLVISAFKRQKASDLICLMLVLVPLALRALHIK